MSEGIEKHDPVGTDKSVLGSEKNVSGYRAVV